MKIRTFLFLLITAGLLSGCRFQDILQSFVVSTPVSAEAALPDPAYPIVNEPANAQPEPTATPFTPSAQETLEPTPEPSPLPPPTPFPTPTVVVIPDPEYDYVMQTLISTNGAYMWTRLCKMGTYDWYANRVCQDNYLQNGVEYHPWDWSTPVDLNVSLAGVAEKGVGSLGMFTYLNRSGVQIVNQIALNLDGTRGWVRECEINLRTGDWICPQSAVGMPLWEPLPIEEMLAEVDETGFVAFSTHAIPEEYGGGVRQTFFSQDGLRYFTRVCPLDYDGPHWDQCNDWIRGDLPARWNPKLGRYLRSISALADFYYYIDDPSNPNYNGLYMRQSFVSNDLTHGFTHGCKISELRPDLDQWVACLNDVGGGGRYDLSTFIFTSITDQKLQLPNQEYLVESDIVGYGTLVFQMTQPLFDIPTDH